MAVVQIIVYTNNTYQSAPRLPAVSQVLGISGYWALDQLVSIMLSISVVVKFKSPT